jgi:UDP-N-acetylmuramoyl-tripeptide--D-alanyl-D-alanine ligase
MYTSIPMDVARCRTSSMVTFMNADRSSGIKLANAAEPMWGQLTSQIPPPLRSRLKAAYERLVVMLGAAYRRVLLRRVVFIGVTGSCGKSTSKELIAAVLTRRFKVHRSPRGENQPFPLAKAIFGVPPWAGYCVVELTPAGMKERIAFEQPLRLAKPQIGVVTNIGDDHITMFGSRDAIAAEKGKLVEALPKDGVAILNADDVRVMAMRTRFSGRVITYGAAPGATIRAENIRGGWPERLSFTVICDGQSQSIQTQLCGTHWVHSMLAAIAVGMTAGMPLSEIAEVVQSVEPFTRRLRPVECNGITFIRDDWKASLATVAPAFEFMKDATASRKIVLLGTISDYGNLKSRRIYASLAAQALECADHVVFVGPQASSGLKARHHADEQAFQAFYSVEEAVDYLRGLLRPGDLVLLKGTRRHDNFQAVMDAVSAATGEHKRVDAATCLTPAQPRAIRIIVGVGNTGEQYQRTRHNIGQRVLDSVAQTLRADWNPTEQGLVSVAEWHGETLYLLKPKANVNHTGPVVRQLADDLGVRPAECILVHDELQLPLGTVRTRMGGRDGGHKGIRSVHQAFGTDAIPRVKVGVGKPAQPEQVADFVLKAFSPAEVPVVEQACAQAADQVLAIIALKSAQGAAQRDQNYPPALMQQLS